uniref:Ribosome biogenesis protein BOP1 homolog n=1 Tax=Fagus sylvatica TaxID=28930 RepID=A0A2N9FNB2_FAGSY
MGVEMKKEKGIKKRNNATEKPQQQQQIPSDSDSDSDSDADYEYEDFSEDGGSDGSLSDSEAGESGESGSSGDEGVANSDVDDGLQNDNGQEDQSDGSESHQGAEESDSSEDEVAPRNTVGDVPLEWYKDEEHIGYDLSGKKITKKERKDKLDSFLESADDSKNWLKVYDEYNDEDVEVTRKELKLIRRLLKGKAPHGDFDPYAPYVDWFKWDDAKHPLSNAPEPKRRFIPSKWESKKVVKLVRAIRAGLIKPDQPKEEQRFYHLWGDDSSSTEKAKHLNFIPAPKPKLPGHEESYNPSLEYIPTQEEINSYQLMYEEDRPKFIPRRYTSLRSIPAYDNAVKDVFERCLDLYLCPRVRKKRINIDPESLKPKLPSRRDLKPYPVSCYLEYKGHTDAVTSISIDASGQWIASGSLDGTVRIWEVETGRCLRNWEVGEAVQYVAWNPLRELPILAVSVGPDVLILNTGFGDEEEQKKIKELLHVETPIAPDDSGNKVSIWLQDDKHEGIRLRHFKKQKQSKSSRSGLREVSSIALFRLDSWGNVSSIAYSSWGCHPKDVTNVAFHRSYPLFASCSDDCSAYVFHGTVYSDLNQNPLIVPLEILRGHTSSKGRGVMDCKFHPRQPWLFTAGADSVIKLYCH